MRQVERLGQMARNLLEGNFESISLDDLRELAGEQGVESLLILRDLRGRLEQAGYVRDGRAGLELTPRAIRRIGELALEDIYGALKRGAPGAHATLPPRRRRDHHRAQQARTSSASPRTSTRSARCATRCCAIPRTRACRSRIEPAGPRGLGHRPADRHHDGAPARHELVDVVVGALAGGEARRDRDGPADPHALPARPLLHRRLLHARARAAHPRAARAGLEHGGPVHEPAGRPARGAAADRPLSRPRTSRSS